MSRLQAIQFLKDRVDSILELDDTTDEDLRHCSSLMLTVQMLEWNENIQDVNMDDLVHGIIEISA